MTTLDVVRSNTFVAQVSTAALSTAQQDTLAHITLALHATGCCDYPCELLLRGLVSRNPAVTVAVGCLPGSRLPHQQLILNWHWLVCACAVLQQVPGVCMLCPAGQGSGPEGG